MPRSKRPDIAIEAELRLLERRSRIGAAIKEARVRRRWTQTRLAAAASLSRRIVARTERAETRLDVEALQRLALALDLPLTVELGRDPRRDVADAGHLAMQELILGVGRRAGLLHRFELATRPNDPWRSADVVIGSDQQRAAADIECWNVFGDIGAAVRSSQRKVAELHEIAVARWGADARASLCWVVRSTVRNRELVRRYPEVFAAAFPGSSTAWVASLRGDRSIPAEPGLVWTDLRASRIFAWRRLRQSSTSFHGDGGKSAA
jgi:transcriptional regulator with XRE-family HTH domain